jgi:GPH family glycoside/pentoside/hexuronide:cation symporter
MIVRLIDTLIDPGLGILMDRSRTPFGRYRVWLIGGAPVLMAAAFMLFDPPGAVNQGYLIVWVLILYIGLSIITLSQIAWASVIAAAYHERSRVFGVIGMLGVLGATAVLLVPSLIKSRDIAGDARVMGWFIVATAPISVLLAGLLTREPIIAHPEGERVGLADYWTMISRPDMRRIIIADFCLALGPGWMAALYLFYFHDARGFTSEASRYLLAIYIVAGVVGAIALSYVATRVGKHKTLMGAAGVYSVGLAMLPLLPQAQFGPAAILMFALGFAASCFPLLDRAMVADVGDAVRLEQGAHRVGLLFSMITASQKVATALSIGVTFTALGLIGYNPAQGAANTPRAVFGMELVYLIGPIVFVALGGACYIGYKLNHERHAEIRAALDARDAQAAQPAAAAE